MSTTVSTMIECDAPLCPRRIEPDLMSNTIHPTKGKVSEIREKARRKGWVYTKIDGSMYDLCYKCKNDPNARKK